MVFQSKMNVLNSTDRKFALNAMRYFGIKRLNIDWSDSTKKWPDIWVYPNERPPRIVVTPEWRRQNLAERQKRLVHEMLHIIGKNHNESIGYSTYPNKDTYSKMVYRFISNPAKSISQQKFFAIALGIKRGEISRSYSEKAAKVADRLSERKLQEFAKEIKG